MAAVGGFVLTWTAAEQAAAALLFDQNVTPNVIMGTGIGNGSWTVDRSNDIELGLRGKTRHNAAGVPDGTYNSNGDGTYQTPVNYNAGRRPESIVVGDFNGDTQIDLAVANSFSSLAILLGNGDGTF